jgi:hypothetical protein
MRDMNSLWARPAARAVRGSTLLIPGTRQFRVAGLAFAAALSLSLHSASIPIPNGSFESPTPPPGFPVSIQIDDWQKSTQPDWYDPSSGIGWEQLSGLFPNTPTGSADHIENMDGNQAAYMFALPEVALFQELTATYEVGMSYELTVGILGTGGMTEPSSFALSLYYLDDAEQSVSIATTPIEFSPAAFPDANHLVDYQVNLVEVEMDDDWAGREIGIRLASTSGSGAGYWDLDQVRLVAVPEPSGIGLLALGLGGLAFKGWHARRRNRSS